MAHRFRGSNPWLALGFESIMRSHHGGSTKWSKIAHLMARKQMRKREKFLNVTTTFRGSPSTTQGSSTRPHFLEVITSLQQHRTKILMHWPLVDTEDPHCSIPLLAPQKSMSISSDKNQNESYLLLRHNGVNGNRYTFPSQREGKKE